MISSRSILLATVVSLIAVGALAHGNGDGHDETTAPALELPTEPVTALPWEVGGAYALDAHTGTTRTEADPEGKFQLVFFGYANCPGICSAALPMMGQVVDVLSERGIDARPVLITIDPVLDTVETMGPNLKEFSEEFVGLTGSREALQVAYDAFSVSFEKIFDDPQYGPIYSHGSHIYLMDASGEVLTLLPPILPAEQVADIVARYATGPS